MARKNQVEEIVNENEHDVDDSVEMEGTPEEGTEKTPPKDQSIPLQAQRWADALDLQVIKTGPQSCEVYFAEDDAEDDNSFCVYSGGISKLIGVMYGFAAARHRFGNEDYIPKPSKISEATLEKRDKARRMLDLAEATGNDELREMAQELLALANVKV
jgi:hypothetical protein